MGDHMLITSFTPSQNGELFNVYTFAFIISFDQ